MKQRIKIHKVGAMVDGIQKCELCGEVLFAVDKKDPQLFRVPQRTLKVHNSTTKPVIISAKGWTVGINLKDCGRKMEATTENPTCHKTQ